MADEFDRRFLPDVIQTSFAVSLGAAYKSLNMMRSPMESIPQMLVEVKSLVELPADGERSAQAIAQAIAGNILAKGAELMQACKTAGERFTEDKKPA
jgi:hypothetical protein